MSPQDSTDRKSALSLFNIYTVMLLLAFLALCIGCTLLAMELGRYKWDTKASTAPRAALRAPLTLAQVSLPDATIRV